MPKEARRLSQHAYDIEERHTKGKQHDMTGGSNKNCSMDKKWKWENSCDHINESQRSAHTEAK